MEKLKSQGVMPWMSEDEVRDMDHVEALRDAIRKSKGLLKPKDNVEALGYLTYYFSKASERRGKYEAMRNEYFAKLLLDNPDLAIGRAEAIAKGSEFGQKKAYYEALAAGYQEIVNSLKKTQEFWNQDARNQY